MLILIHGLAGGASWVNALPVIVKLLILLAVSISLSGYLLHFCYQFQPYILSYTADLGWQLCKKNNQLETVQVLPSTVITTELIVLHLQCQQQKTRRVVIFNDALSDKDYRALVVMLKIYRHTQ